MAVAANGPQAVLDDFKKVFPETTPLSSNDAAEAARHIAANTKTADEARPFIERLIAGNQASRLGLGLIALSVAGVIAAAVVIYGIFFQAGFLSSLAKPDAARGLVTFLFAVATIAVVLITIIATFWVKADEVAARSGVAKEIITILIGIMGTILGFYFGSAPVGNQTAPQETAAAVVTQ